MKERKYRMVEGYDVKEDASYYLIEQKVLFGWHPLSHDGYLANAFNPVKKYPSKDCAIYFVKRFKHRDAFKPEIIEL